ncbi:MAG: DNA-binding MarR family transcriptional regulator [Gammaproteobacteria bacterium]|jgi:DNA-binding MarR family transcriptional regulator
MKKHRKPLKLESFLPYRLSLLSNTVSSNIAATYQDKFGISMPEWRIMAVLAEYPDIAADEVCQRTQIEKSVVSRAVARLLKRHLIFREFDDKDKRRSILRLSETGLTVYDEVMPVTETFELKLIAKLSKDERKSLSILLDKLQTEAGNIDMVDD